MIASISQKDGLTLSIDPSPVAGDDVLVVRLSGGEFGAKIEVGNEPNGGVGRFLASFLGHAVQAQPGERFEWSSPCGDLSVSVTAEPGGNGLLTLDVSMSSNSDDNCDWNVHASLSVDPSELRQFSAAVPKPTW